MTGHRAERRYGNSNAKRRNGSNMTSSTKAGDFLSTCASWIGELGQIGSVGVIFSVYFIFIVVD